MERMASPTGPTGGKILRPSNGEAPANVAFVQCAGSRDVNHLNYCSGVCCLASLKQAQYVKEQLPDAEVTMYYIDRRTPGRNEDVLLKTTAHRRRQADQGQGRPRRSKRTASSSSTSRTSRTRRILEAEHDLVVLATGMVPNAVDDDLAVFTRKDDDGFVLDDIELERDCRRRRPTSGGRRGIGTRRNRGCSPGSRGSRKEGVMDKLGVFLCTGCGIGEAIDVDEVIEAADEHGCACTLTHECFCGPEGLEAIKSTVAENELDGILVAACSERAKTTEFAALTVDGPSMFRTALREHCAWPLKNAEEDEDKTACAKDMVQMGLARLDGVKAIEPLSEEISDTVMVVGSGRAGLEAALTARPVSATRWSWSRRTTSSAVSWPTRSRSRPKSRPTSNRKRTRFRS